tara:strand:+ start:671 stop:868 length:198 start_codon:yes stop_codon:yes gene_type:complete
MRLLRIDQVKEQTGLSKASIYKQIRLGNFPSGVKITSRSTAWPSDHIEDWINKQIAKSEERHSDE